MMSILSLIPAGMVGYLLGSIPSGVLLARLFGWPDPRRHGSGHTGAMNSSRAGGVRALILVMVADLLKGTLAVWLAMQISPQDFSPAVAGIAAVVGHNWPVWLGFRGGMGLATGAGAFLPVFWPAVLIGIGLLALFNLIIRRRPRATVFTTLFTPIITLLLRADLASQLLITGACLIIGLKTLGDWNRTDG